MKVVIDDGYYLFNLDNILKERNISKNKIMRDTNTDFKVLQRIINGELTRFDIIVLARICNYLKCNLSDIIEYYPELSKDLSK